MILTKNRGFTLIELMIGLVISSFVLIGITSTYATIQGTIQTSKDLENAQEVIRYSSQVFTRSLKQTLGLPAINGNQIVAQQSANARSCLGTNPVFPYQETFTFVQPNLSCSIQDAVGGVVNADTRLLTGISNMTPVINGDLFSVLVLPTVLPLNFGVGAGAGIRIDIALNARILQARMP